MAEDPKSKPIIIADFAGLIDSEDPRDLPPGAAQDQVNLTCLQKGRLDLRGGLRRVTFEGE